MATPSMIGIDVQANEVRLVKLKRKKRQFQIEWAMSSSLLSAVSGEGKMDRFDHLAVNLRQLLGKKAVNMWAAIALPANLVRMHTLPLPIGLTEAAIMAEIERHIHQDLPGVKEALGMDFFSVPRAEAGYADVSFAAGRQDILSQYSACMKTAGLNLKIVDIDIYALNRAVSFLLPDVISTEDHLVLYFCPTQAVLLAIHQKQLIFHQTWNFTTAEDFSMQLKRTIQYCISAHPKAKIKHLVICANNALVDLVSDLQTQYAFDLYYPNVLSAFEIQRSHEITPLIKNPTDFLVALGLAMREGSTW